MNKLMDPKELAELRAASDKGGCAYSSLEVSQLLADRDQWVEYARLAQESADRLAVKVAKLECRQNAEIEGIRAYAADGVPAAIEDLARIEAASTVAIALQDPTQGENSDRDARQGKKIRGYWVNGVVLVAEFKDFDEWTSDDHFAQAFDMAESVIGASNETVLAETKGGYWDGCDRVEWIDGAP